MSAPSQILCYFFDPETLDVRVSSEYGDFEHQTKEWIFHDTSSTSLRFRTPRHISYEGWAYVPHKEFPAEFKTYLMMIGASIG